MTSERSNIVVLRDRRSTSGCRYWPSSYPTPEYVGTSGFLPKLRLLPILSTMSSRAPIYILSNRDPAILTLFTSLLSANATPPMTIQVVTEISNHVVHAFLDYQKLPATIQVTLIPVLRAGSRCTLQQVQSSPTATQRWYNAPKTDPGMAMIACEWNGWVPIRPKLHGTPLPPRSGA